MPRATEVERRLTVLLRDEGYRFNGNDLIRVGIRGFTSDRIVGRRRSLLDAAESLIPIIHTDEYHTRYSRITTPEN